ncbi:MAG: hypothetical protein ACJAUC_002289, partial [Planctomycetota bacterium]
ETVGTVPGQKTTTSPIRSDAFIPPIYRENDP